MISRSVTHLQRVIDRDDVIALKAVQIRMAMLEMSDAMRGYLLDPTNQATEPLPRTSNRRPQTVAASRQDVPHRGNRSSALIAQDAR
jgi:hypothetical protein